MTKAEKIQYIKENVSIIEYAQYMGYTVKQVGRWYTLKEHDSVRINVQKNYYYRNSTSDDNSKGSIFNFVMHFRNYSEFNDAYDELIAYIGEGMLEGERVKPKKPKMPVKKEKKMLVLPTKANTRKHVYAYLTYTRKIDKDVINYFFDNKYLYEDERKNCVFLGYDMKDREHTTPIFANLRGTNTYKAFKGDAEGSQYDYCFYINNTDASILYVNESVIDTMSIMTMLPKEQRNNVSYLALASTQKWQAIFNYLMANPEIEIVYLCMDNDNGGRDVLEVIKTHAKDNNFSQEFIDYLPSCKDWNEELIKKVSQ